MTRAVYMPGVCRECGCTDERACPGGCSWVEPDLCSQCAEEIEEDSDEAELYRFAP